MLSLNNRFDSKIIRDDFDCEIPTEKINSGRSRISSIYNEIKVKRESPNLRTSKYQLGLTENKSLPLDLKRKRSPSPENRKKQKIEQHFSSQVLQESEKIADMILSKIDHLNEKNLQEHLHIYSKKEDIALVFALMKNAEQRGVNLDKFNYTSLLNCAVNQNNINIDLVRAIYNMMLESKIHIDSIFSRIIQRGYIKAIKDCLVKREFHVAEELLIEMIPIVYKNDDYQIQVAHGIVINNYVESYELDKAVFIYKRMLSSGINSDEVIYTTLLKGFLREIQGCINRGELEKAHDQLKEIAQFKNKVHDEHTIEKISLAYVMVINAYISTNNTFKVAETFMEWGCSNPNYKLCNSLIHFFLINNVEDVARKLFNFIEKDYSFEIYRDEFDCHNKSAGTSYLAIETYLNNLKENESLTVITGKGLHSKSNEMYDLQRKLIKIVYQRHSKINITIDKINSGQIIIRRS